MVGHSLGGVVALAFAGRHPELAPAVVAYEAPDAVAAVVAVAHRRRRRAGRRRWRGATRPSGSCDGWSATSGGRRSRSARRTSGAPRAPRWWPSCARSGRRHHRPYDPATLAVPVLAAHGSESRPHHQGTARVLAESAPLGELTSWTGPSHGVHLTHPGAVAGLVRSALQRGGA